MAHGIMADKKDKVTSPTSEQSTNSTKLFRNSNTLNDSTAASTPPAAATTTTAATAAAVAASPCSCTKISTMQLFYEMKQKFPTVPDNVVCEFVGQNCHNRSACIDGLEDYPNSANVYPQALRNQPIKKKTQATAATATVAGVNQTDSRTIIVNQPHQSMTKHPNTTDSEQMTNATDVSNVQQRKMPPTTLNLKNLNCCMRPINRPTRQAPPPPMVTIATGATTPTISTTPTQSTAMSLPNQPLNLSVNVIVSPVSRTPKSQQSHYSFTLHQPNTSKCSTQSTNSHPAADGQSASAETIATAKTPPMNAHIDVPSLKYTSSAYDAEIGYQSRLEITVAGISPKTNCDDNCDPLNDNANDEISNNNNNNNNNVLLARSCDATTSAAAVAAATSTAVGNQLPSVMASSEFLEETETLHHQILCKQKLMLELEKDRKRLERMQRELQAIQAPMPDGGLAALNQEIEKLRDDCKLMAQFVEEAGPSYALGETNEAFYRNIYTGQQLPMQQRPLRPHRPAPIPDFNQTQNRNMNHINVAAGTDPCYAATTSIPQTNRSFIETNEDGWVCELCTFQNKYTQRTCELCTMPFLSAGNQMGYNGGIFASMPPLPSQSLQQQPQQPYPLTQFMPMQMQMPMPYSLHNNNNNMPYVHSYYGPQSMPAPSHPFYVYDTSRF